MTRRELGLRALAMVLTTRLASAQSPSATTVVRNVQHVYAGASAFTASFRQTVTNATFKTTKTIGGRLWVLKPSDFRWDYLEKRKGTVTVVKTYILDGATLWLIDHSKKQIFEDTTQSAALPAALSFLTGGTALTSQFTVAIDTSGKFGTKGTIVLSLTPNQPSQDKQILFVIDDSDWHVQETVVVDATGNMNDFRFYDPDLVSPVKATLFHVNPASFPTYKLTQVNQAGSGAAGSAANAPAPGNAGSAAVPLHNP